ncbi:MAG: C45 family peptidase [Thermoflexales bacterium]|nr:C45 family peptidase [Thermoflexales bacterium]MCS7324352.1 C45 family peptidase [Thermoflexales bacterium]MCX7938931.1 C45 family peptidase [Thermoflexales bacterium]MDW8054854.1 C45 family peptidase [Anaerolineae bacterium]MDW8293059.1 C45 family peptidase [Anaerolineae bacterium]
MSAASAALANEQPDYRYFDIFGSHAALGFALGQADPPFRMQFWWWPPPPLAFAWACRDVVRELHPHLIDECDAYADAQRIPKQRFWQQTCRVNLKARLRSPHAPAVEMGEGCSSFAWFTPQGYVVVGRNYDYLPQQARRQRIRFTPDCCALPSLGARGSVPCGRYDGINRHGVFAALHVVMTDTPPLEAIRPGVPFHLVVRLALELCDSAREAADLISRIPHLSSLNYLVADAREAFVIEADPRRVRVLPREGDVVAATNHFRHPEMTPLMGARSVEHSACRLAFLLRASSAAPIASADDALARAQRIMADRSVPMCGTQGSLTTLWSCVAELGTRRIRYAPGAPCRTPFEELPAP